MTSQPPRRPNTADIVMARRQGKNYYTASTGAEASADAAAELPSAGAQQILDAIAELRADLSNGKMSAAHAENADEAESAVETEAADEAEPDAPAVDDVAVRENEELRKQLAELSVAISETKREISSLRDPAASSAEDVKAATLELDAVVNSTESATNDIMEAAESIDDLAAQLTSQLTSDADRALAEDINERVIKIFEACNFQDITGQRITKVVNTLKFVDERVGAMMTLWGAVPGDADAAARPDTEGDDHLLNGPALEGEASSQEDIDALFD